MRKFVNEIGCNMSFDEGISDEQIKERLSFMPNSNWIEVKED